MTTEYKALPGLPLRGLWPWVFIALGIVTGLIDLQVDSRALLWLSLMSTALGLVFSRTVRRLPS